MNFKYAIDTTIEDLDEKKGDPKLIEKLKNYINRGYKELAKREGKLIPNSLINDNDVFLSYVENDEFIINYAKWLYYLADQDTENASVFKQEYEGMRLYNPKVFDSILDVYGGLTDV